MPAHDFGVTHFQGRASNSIRILVSFGTRESIASVPPGSTRFDLLIPSTIKNSAERGLWAMSSLRLRGFRPRPLAPAPPSLSFPFLSVPPARRSPLQPQQRLRCPPQLSAADLIPAVVGR